MNSRAANSGGFADPVPPPPPVEVFVVLPDGSCIPATSGTLKMVLRQARSAASKQARLRADEKAAELQRNLEDRAAARRLLQELADIDRDRRRIAATLRGRVKADRPAPQTSDVVKRAALPLSRRPIPMTRVPSSWVVDDLGMRGVHYSQSYIGRKSPGFYQGAARDRWLYEARDEAVLRDRDGDPIIITNLGDDIDEIGAAWQAIEDATTRANGKIQIRIIVACDADASTEEQVAGLTHFCESVLAPLGLPYSGVIHRPPDNGDQRNVHAHILTNLRPTKRIAPYTWAFADHVRGELDGKNGVQMLRHLWAHSLSAAAEKAHRNMRYTGLGYGARGLDLEAGEHLGEGKSAMVARDQRVWAWERNRIKNARNAARRAIRDADVKIAALTKVRDAAIAQMKAEEQVEPARSFVSARLSSPPQERFHAAMMLGAPPKRIESAPVVSIAPRVSPASPAHLVSLVRTSSRSPIPGRLTRRTPAKAAADPSPSRIASTTAAIATPRRTVATDARTSLSRSDRFRASAPGNPLPVRLAAAEAAVDRPRRIAAAVPPAAAVRLFRSATSADRSHGPSLISANRSVAKGAPAPRLPSAETIPVADPAIVEAEEMLRSIRRYRSGLHARRTKVRARWRKTSTTNRAGETIADVPTLADIPTREWFETHPMRTYRGGPSEDAAGRARLAQIARIDPYVADLRDGTFDIDYGVLTAIGVDADWLKGPAVQQGLAVIRAEQQQIVAALAAEAGRRPLDFATHGKRFWPRNLAPAELARLDRWAADDGLQTDLVAIERTVRAAHNASDARRGLPNVARPTSIDAPLAKLAKPVPDGLGGMRDTPPPVYRLKETGVRLLPFDKATGRPSKSVLMLLRHCGEHPGTIVFADDGRLMSLDGVPKLIDPLIHMWRHDDRVQALVVETVTASRQAGWPVWPLQHASAIRALSSATEPPRAPPSDRDFGTRR